MKWVEQEIQRLKREQNQEGDITLAKATALWAKVRSKQNKSFRTVSYQIKAMLQYFGASKTLQDLTPEDVERYSIYLKDTKNLKDASVNRYKALLKAIINYARNMGYFKTMERNPVSVVGMASEKRKPRYFTEEEMDKLSKTAKCVSNNHKTKNQFWFHIYFTIFKFTGMRPGEIMKLKWEDYRDGYFRVNLSNTKEKCEKLIPVHPHLSDFLNQIPRISDYIIGVNNRQRNPETFRKVWNRIKSLSGVQGRLYNIRHSFATQLLKNGGNIKTISALLGHSSVTTTEIYAQVVNEDKERVIGFLPESYKD